MAIKAEKKWPDFAVGGFFCFLFFKYNIGV